MFNSTIAPHKQWPLVSEWLLAEIWVQRGMRIQVPEYQSRLDSPRSGPSYVFRNVKPIELEPRNANSRGFQKIAADWPRSDEIFMIFYQTINKSIESKKHKWSIRLQLPRYKLNKSRSVRRSRINDRSISHALSDCQIQWSGWIRLCIQLAEDAGMCVKIAFALQNLSSYPEVETCSIGRRIPLPFENWLGLATRLTKHPVRRLIAPRNGFTINRQIAFIIWILLQFLEEPASKVPAWAAGPRPMFKMYSKSQMQL
jgi:hypothetical protein